MQNKTSLLFSARLSDTEWKSRRGLRRKRQLWGRKGPRRDGAILGYKNGRVRWQVEVSWRRKHPDGAMGVKTYRQGHEGVRSLAC